MDFTRFLPIRKIDDSLLEEKTRFSNTWMVVDLEISPFANQGREMLQRISMGFTVCGRRNSFCNGSEFFTDDDAAQLLFR